MRILEIASACKEYRFLYALENAYYNSINQRSRDHKCSYCNSPAECNKPKKTEQYVTKDDCEAIGKFELFYIKI